MTLSLVVVTLAIFATPMLLSRFKISVLPTSVAEVIVGIILGQSGLHLVKMNTVLDYLSTLGVIFLMFLSGMEIDFSLFKKNSKNQMTPLELKQANAQPKASPLKTAVVAYILSCVTAVVLAVLQSFRIILQLYARNDFICDRFPGRCDFPAQGK